MEPYVYEQKTKMPTQNWHSLRLKSLTNKQKLAIILGLDKPNELMSKLPFVSAGGVIGERGGL